MCHVQTLLLIFFTHKKISKLYEKTIFTPFRVVPDGNDRWRKDNEPLAILTTTE
ncbi:hypothetical protein HMPREF3226_02813 [Prevotella corporis]|uniref:Uncharacterized protein n=1 Tax=Prevotella corporis TaxID=28128 RepID=A0A133PSW4_9BACT|nr:hypothetical protein HMPREF3226_02813 [Prevotella corporis]